MEGLSKKLSLQASSEASCYQQTWRHEGLPLEGDLTRLRAVGQVMRGKEISVCLEMSDDAGHLAVRPPLGRAGHRTGRAGGPGKGNGRERAACGPPACDLCERNFGAS